MIKSRADYQSARFEHYVRGGRQFEDWRPYRDLKLLADAMPAQRLPESAEEDWEIWSPICRHGLGCRLVEVAYPGGEDRKAIRLYLDDKSTVIASARPLGSTLVEARVLASLRSSQLDLPRLLFVDRHLALQTDLGDDRLSLRLRDDPHRIAPLALESLIKLQRAGSVSGLDRDLPEIGGDSWLARLLQQPDHLGKALQAQAPDFDHVAVAERLRQYNPRFVRWDARAGNAIKISSKSIAWFDFETSGVRARLDDLVWLMADENFPDNPALEALLFQNYLHEFADGLSETEARAYVLTYGVLHSLVRAGYILAEKGARPWSDYMDGIDEDRASIDPSIYQRVMTRAARWASEVSEFRSLKPWLVELADHVPD